MGVILSKTRRPSGWYETAGGLTHCRELAKDCYSVKEYRTKYPAEYAGMREARTWDKIALIIERNAKRRQKEADAKNPIYRGRDGVMRRPKSAP